MTDYGSELLRRQLAGEFLPIVIVKTYVIAVIIAPIDLTC